MLGLWRASRTSWARLEESGHLPSGHIQECSQARGVHAWSPCASQSLPGALERHFWALVNWKCLSQVYRRPSDATGDCRRPPHTSGHLPDMLGFRLMACVLPRVDLLIHQIQYPLGGPGSRETEIFPLFFIASSADFIFCGFKTKTREAEKCLCVFKLITNIILMLLVKLKTICCSIHFPPPCKPIV